MLVVWSRYAKQLVSLSSFILKLLNTICYRLHGTPDDREAASSCGEAMKPVAFVSFSVNGFGLELWWVWWLAPVEIQFKAELRSI